jgi:hypothetical protein
MEAFSRQQRRCAICAVSLADQWDEGHHVIPAQLGNRRNATLLSSVDNCVMLCIGCHGRAHGGNTKSGAVPPPAYYECSHGPKGGAPHDAWVARLQLAFDQAFDEIARKQRA